MQVDWVTITAQIANFLVLIWLLQRFLYAPITKAMAEREKRIEQRLADARRIGDEAADELRALHDRQEALEANREEILGKARKDADSLRARLEADLRAEIQRKHDTWLDHLGDKQTELTTVVQRRVAAQVFDITRRVLADFANADLETQLADVFIDRLESIDDDTRARLTEDGHEDHAALVETGIELPAPVRGRITRAIHHELARKTDVRYRTDPEILLGIRLTFGDQTVEWSAARYLDRLQSQIDEALQAALAEQAAATRT